jgi:hypothetical protein
LLSPFHFHLKNIGYWALKVSRSWIKNVFPCSLKSISALETLFVSQVSLADKKVIFIRSKKEEKEKETSD